MGAEGCTLVKDFLKVSSIQLNVLLDCDIFRTAFIIVFIVYYRLVEGPGVARKKKFEEKNLKKKI